jgi:hypothetical protein
MTDSQIIECIVGVIKRGDISFEELFDEVQFELRSTRNFNLSLSAFKEILDKLFVTGQVVEIEETRYYLRLGKIT